MIMMEIIFILSVRNSLLKNSMGTLGVSFLPLRFHILIKKLLQNSQSSIFASRLGVLGLWQGKF